MKKSLTINNEQQSTIRDSGIELLKIFAIFFIVISHVVQTLVSENIDINYNGYVIDISKATTDIQHIFLIIFQHFGVFGNSIFFICSAWFLLNKNNYNKRKCFFMLLEIWAVSITILIITYVILHGDISVKLIIKSIFPTTFSNNWYMTCYLIFCTIYPILNNIIKNMNQIQLLRTTLFLTLLYIIGDFIKQDLFFPSSIILWVTIYFIMAYIQFYETHFINNIKNNVVLLILSIVGFICTILFTDVGGLYISFLSDKVLHWVNNCNPFLIAISIALFNIARNIHFKNRFINYISSLSLLIYIIHENIIIRTYFRPAMWNFVYEHYGYKNIIVWVFILTIIVFVFAFSCALFYDISIRKLIAKFANKLYDLLKVKYIAVEQKIVKLKI